MIARNGPSEFERIRLDNRAVLDSEAVRLDQLTEAMSGVMRRGDDVAAASVAGLSVAVDAEVDAYIADGPSVEWHTSGTHRYAGLRVKPGGGLVVGADGVFTDPSGVAPAPHTHAQLHDPLTVQSGASLSLSVAGQQISGSVIVQPGGGLVIGGDGVAVDYGPSGVARASHTHADQHAALTVQSSDSLTLSLSGQELSGAVRVKSSGGLVVGADGVRVDMGQGAAQCASGDHAHSAATSSSAGFLSAADKRKLDLFGVIANADQVVTFHSPSSFSQGAYIGGRVRWGQSMSLLAVDVAAKNAPLTDSTLGIEVNGVVVDTVSIPGGVGEVLNSKTISPDLAVDADAYIRILCLSGVGSAPDEAAVLDVALMVRPAVATADPVRLNCGGGASDPYSDDAYHNGLGSLGTTAQSIDRSAVTDPAPAAVYQAWRAKYFDSAPIVYLIPGLVRGLSYLVRLHFAENYWNNVGDQKFNILVTGSTSVSHINYDILAATGGVKRKAVVREWTIQPSSLGEIEVRLQPMPGTGQYLNCSINGIEIIPIA